MTGVAIDFDHEEVGTIFNYQVTIIEDADGDDAYALWVGHGWKPLCGFTDQDTIKVEEGLPAALRHFATIIENREG